ncbi:hypothetical protein HG619_14960 [Pseudomonas syringae]|nr:hypothetical protein [Pseudomonas syringae]
MSIPSPTMKILYGPPGTGKTWHAAREAVKAIEPARYEQAIKDKNPDETLRTLHEQLVNEGRILWVTFHPSYSYEDFVEGYRPVVDDSGQLAYRVIDGPFKALCLRAKFETDLQIGEQLKNSSGGLAGVVVGKDSGGWIVRVTAKRSDKVAASLDKYVPRFVVDRILSMGFPHKYFQSQVTAAMNFQSTGYLRRMKMFLALSLMIQVLHVMGRLFVKLLQHAQRSFLRQT